MIKQGSSLQEICSFLTDKLKQADLSNKLTIIDPYAFAFDINNPKNLKNPTEVLTNILKPLKGRFSTLEIVIGSQNSTNRPEQHQGNLENILDVNIKVLRTPSFHDRFWIVDDRLAFIVGASINSFGNKHFFIQNSFLDAEDTNILLELYRNGVNKND